MTSPSRTRPETPRSDRCAAGRGGQVGAFLLALGALAPLTPAQERAPLTDAIPDDVFLVTLGFPNPEREFLDDYWRDVWDAFQASGVMDDVLELMLSTADAETRAQIEGYREQCEAWCEGVDWESFLQSEILFAERLMEPVRAGRSVSGPPDMVFLQRTDAETASANFEGLGTILRGVIAEITKLSGMDLEVREIEIDGTRFLAFDPFRSVPDAPPFDISVGLRDDVLIVSIGQTIRDEVAGLLGGHSTLRPMSKHEGFQAAMKRLPPAEDSFQYVDIQNLRGSFEKIAASVLDAIEASSSGFGDGDIITNARENDEANALTRASYEVYQKGDYAEALRLSQQAHQIDETDSVVMYNLACFHALTGQPEKALEWLAFAVEGGFYAPEKISEDSDLDTLRSDPRFTEILAQARELAGQHGAEHASASSPELSIAKLVIDRVLSTVGMFDYVATSAYMEDHSMYMDAVVTLQPGAKENPFYAVVNTPSVADFSQFLPKETTGFEVSGGFDFTALYDFLYDSVAEVGDPGLALLAQWEAQQEQMGLDVREDVLGLLGTGMVSVKFENATGGDEWVMMAGIRKPEVVSQYLGMGVQMLPAIMADAMQQNPMLGMLALEVKPSTALEGFHEVSMGMSQDKMVVGVHESWLVLGSSANAVKTTRATAAGEHPNIRDNETMFAKAIFPVGPAQSVRFSDQSRSGEEAATMLRTVPMMGPMMVSQVPDPEARKMLGKLFLVMGKLAPVVQRIDFYDSRASATTFDGKAWSTRSVTHFRPPSGSGEHAGSTQ